MDIKAIQPVTTVAERPVAALPTAPTPVPTPAASSTPAINLTEATVNTSGGVFIRSSDSEGLPRWVVMTALRAYGLNLNKTLPEERQQLVQREQATIVEQNQTAAKSIAAVTPQAIEKIVAQVKQAVTPSEKTTDIA